MNLKEQNLYFKNEKPIWVKVRPKNYSEFVDFASLGKLRQRFLEKPFSFLLYGPPGVGKSTFLEILVKESGLNAMTLPSYEISLENLRKILQEKKDTFVVVVEEIHRLAKHRQDFFLNPLEQGEVILLATTTESPWYYVSRPLLSRLVVKEVLPPPRDVFLEIVKKNAQKFFQIDLKKIPLEKICEKAWPDLRLALKALELYPLAEKNEAELFLELESFFSLNRPMSLDNTTKEYDFLSALIKSIRGSDPNSALLYLAALLNLGCDPTIIARRLVILASEDVGLANPQALVLAQASFSAIEKIGMPEAQIILAEVVIYLAASPKSNSAYKAISKALEYVKEKEIHPPKYILNNHPQIKEYKYPHDYGGFILQNYWPEDLPREDFYEGKKTSPLFLFDKESIMLDQFEKLWKSSEGA